MQSLSEDFAPHCIAALSAILAEQREAEKAQRNAAKYEMIRLLRLYAVKRGTRSGPQAVRLEQEGRATRDASVPNDMQCLLLTVDAIFTVLQRSDRYAPQLLLLRYTPHSRKTTHAEIQRVLGFDAKIRTKNAKEAFMRELIERGMVPE